MEDLSGKQLGQYQLIAPLGKGGMAVVYKAYQPSMERYVAIKILPRHLASEQDFVQRFKQEAKIIASLEHPNILSVHDYGEADGYSYLVMRYIEGGMTLTDLLKGQPLPLPQIRGIIKEIADALDYAHARGVIHRDIKPSNVLIDQQGHTLLSDFGLAKIMGTSAKLTNSGAFIGTPTYASPEQCLGLGDVDQRSDIYSLGVILYEMATGRPPFDAETPMAIVLMHVQDPLPAPRNLNPALPEDIERIILKALAKDRESRYQTAGKMAGALAEALEKLTIPAGKITLQAPEHTVQANIPALPPASPIVQSKRTADQISKQMQTALIVGLVGLVCIGAAFGLSWSAMFLREKIIVGNPVTIPTEPIAAPTSIQTQPMASTEKPADTPTPGLVRWSGNNHTYEVVRVPGGINWEAANQAAQEQGGHLATITSKAENDFVFSIASSSKEQEGLWLGGYQSPNSAEPNGGWAWVTGEPWEYTNWDSGEPNNGLDGNSQEKYLQFHWENSPLWNDITADAMVGGYIAEYETPEMKTSTSADQIRAFTSPILAAIRNQPPDFSDNFSDPNSGWSSGSNTNGDKWGYEAGILYISCTPNSYCGVSLTKNRPAPNFSDYIMEVDAQFVSGDWGTWEISVLDVPSKTAQLQKVSAPRNYWLSFTPDGTYDLGWKSDPEYDSLANGRTNAFAKENGTNHLTLIVRGLQIALILNDEPLFLAYDDAAQGGKLALSLSANNDANSQNPLVVHFDNLKIWDVSKFP